MNAVPVGLLALGLLLVVLEVFFPSLGILSVMAAVSIIAGAVFASQSGDLLPYLTIAFVLLPVVLAAAFKLFPKTPMGRKLMLGGPSFSGEKHTASERDLDALVGSKGIAETALRPAGIASIGERRVDVVSRGTLIDRGSLIKVVKVEGNRVIVEPELPTSARTQ